MILVSYLLFYLNFLKLLFSLEIFYFLGFRIFFFGVLYIYTLSIVFIIINFFEDIFFMNILMFDLVGYFFFEIFLI